ncbi:hypothetical protein C8F01DRAFT_696968 [Mycena amicta]|nr:hypothetical protein C8F01DRAFT_696968 [Mycena amicta]
MAMRHSLASTLLSLSLYLLLVTVTPSAAVVTTRTIDDTNGDSVTGAVPVYNPADQFSLNSNCPGCVYHPDPGGAFDQTWHDTAQLNGAGAMTVSFAFTGTSVSLFCTLVTKQLTSTPVGSTYLALSIDGVSHGTYTHVPASTGDTAGFAYKQKVFEVDGLANIAHNVVLSTNNPQGSYMLFDYASYTFDDGVTPQPPPPPSRTTTTVTNVLVSTSTGTGTTQTTTSTTTASDTRTIGTTGTNNSGTTSPSPGHSSSSSSSSLSSSPPTSSLADSGSVAVTGPSSKKSVNVAAIAAASVGGVLCILLAILIVVLCRRRQRQRHPDSTMQQAQAHPLALALPIHTDYPTDYPAQVRVGHGVDAEPALVPELHYGRAGRRRPREGRPAAKSFRPRCRCEWLASAIGTSGVHCDVRYGLVVDCRLWLWTRAWWWWWITVRQRTWA